MPSAKELAAGLIKYAPGTVDFGHGPRFDNPDQPKAEGFFGRIPLSNGDYATEYSVSQNIDGKNVEMPSIVPTLTKEELGHVMRSSATGSPLPNSVYDKSLAHAKDRISKGQSPFWQIPESYTPMPK